MDKETSCPGLNINGLSIHILSSIILTLLCGATAYAAETNEDLAKKTLNPISDLISVPFQNVSPHDYRGK